MSTRKRNQALRVLAGDALTLEEAIARLTSAPWRNGQEKSFCYATLVRRVEMGIWNGKHPPETNTLKRIAKAGTPVLVTVASRFGDFGIRDDNLEPATDGYYARVPPDMLKDWRTKP